MTDLFEEVEEQLRSERYRALSRRYTPWALGGVAAVLIVVFGYWGWDVWRSGAIAEASEQYDSATQAFGAGDMARASELWTEVSNSPIGGYKSLALMQLAGLQIQEDNIAEAQKLLDQAAEAAPDDIISDMARLKSVFSVLDTAPYQDLEARLMPLMEDGRPYRLQAREALAIGKVRLGTSQARGPIRSVVQIAERARGLKSRAEAAIGLIDSGSVDAVPTVAKAAAALPEPEPLGSGPPAMGEGQASPHRNPQPTERNDVAPQAFPGRLPDRRPWGGGCSTLNSLNPSMGTTIPCKRLMMAREYPS